jgi:hypothetical protein
MSSPDFLLQYQRPYDPDRDWPQVDVDDDVDGVGSTLVIDSDIRRDHHFNDQVNQQIAIIVELDQLKANGGKS